MKHAFMFASIVLLLAAVAWLVFRIILAILTQG